MRLPILQLPAKVGPWPLPVAGIQLALRAALAAGVSLGLAQGLALRYPIYAMIAAVLVTDLTPLQTRQLGRRRLVATVVGAACGAALSPVLGPGPWAVGLGILIAMLTSVLLQMQEAAKVAGYICGIVLLSYNEQSWSYALARLFETALGIGVAWSISLLPKLVRTTADGTSPTPPR